MFWAKRVADCLLVEGWPGRRAGAPGIGKTYPFQICIRSWGHENKLFFCTSRRVFTCVEKTIQIQTLHSDDAPPIASESLLAKLVLEVQVEQRSGSVLPWRPADDFQPNALGSKIHHPQWPSWSLESRKVGKSHRSNHMSAIFNNFPKVISGPCLCQIWKSCDETAVLLG